MGERTTAGTTSTRTAEPTRTRPSSAASGTRTWAGSCGSDWNGTKQELVADLAKYPELRFLNRCAIMLLRRAAVGLACLALGGLHGLVWGFFVSTVLLWHGTFTINSLSHLFGTRRFETTDDSRNNWRWPC